MTEGGIRTLQAMATAPTKAWLVIELTRTTRICRKKTRAILLGASVGPEPLVENVTPDRIGGNLHPPLQYRITVAGIEAVALFDDP